MVVGRDLCLAPWVVRKGNVLLGSKLHAIKIPHLNILVIPTPQLNYLISNNYIISPINQNAHMYSPPFHPLDEKRRNTQLNWIWVSERSFLTVALLLKEYLLLLDPLEPWEIVMNKKMILEDLKNNGSRKPLIIRLSHTEPIEEKIINDLYADLINKTQIVWAGESNDGTHLGPMIRNMDDLEQYLLATKIWYFSKQLIDFGFKDYWPLPIYSHLLSNTKQLAQAILRLAKAPPETCFLIEENRDVCLWTQLGKGKILEAHFFETQFWSKGLIRNFEMKHFDSFNEGYVSKSRSPCQSIDYLEGNSGKGMDSISALYSLVGESVERFAAWQSNKAIATLNTPEDIDTKIIYDIDQFHPFGSKWRDYLRGDKIKLPLYAIKNEIDPHQMVFVPECLIPFPYEAPEPKYDITTSSTAGLAVYSDYTKAVIKGSLELFERNDFYNFFLFQKMGFVLDFSTILSEVEGPLQPFRLLLDHLNSQKLSYWCIVYSSTFTLPIIHCFILDETQHFFSRGTGSGYSFLEAASSALVEALQIREQFLKNNEVSQGYIDWKSPVVIEQIRTYLEQFQRLSFFDHPISTIQYTSSELLDEIKKNVGILQKPLLVAELPCPIIGWSAVRVLIPGFTTHQYPSESLGGQKIMRPVFKFSIPT